MPASPDPASRPPARLARARETLGATLAALVLAPAGSIGCDGDDEPPTRARTQATATEARRSTDSDRPRPQPETAPARRGGSTLVFAGGRDRVLPPIVVRRGGTTIVWTNAGPRPVFSLLTQEAIVIDAAFERRGRRFLPAGRYVLEVVASGRWTIVIPNAARRR